MILFSVLLTEYLGLANLPLALGVHCLVNGLAALPRHALIRKYSSYLMRDHRKDFFKG